MYIVNSHAFVGILFCGSLPQVQWPSYCQDPCDVYSDGPALKLSILWSLWFKGVAQWITKENKNTAQGLAVTRSGSTISLFN